MKSFSLIIYLILVIFVATSKASNKCTSRGGQCMNPNNCNGKVETGLCPGGNDNKCCIGNKTNNSNKCTSRGGQCMNPNNCNGKVETGLCPGGNNNKCCFDNGGGSSSGNDCHRHSTIAEAAVSYAWKTKDMGKPNSGTKLYRAVLNAVCPGDTYYRSCDRGVAAAVRWSGADDNFPAGPTGTQDSYLKRNSDKWTFIGTYAQNYSKLKPGDIVITIPQRNGQGHGHIVLYVGNAEIRKKYPNASGEFVSASLNQRSPGCGDTKATYKTGGYHIYRYKGNYSGSKKNAYKGCASGTS